MSDDEALRADVVHEQTGLLARLLQRVMHHQGVQGAVAKAVAAGVPWAKIIAVIMPFVLALLTGGTLDIPAIIAAILALIQK